MPPKVKNSYSKEWFVTISPRHIDDVDVDGVDELIHSYPVYLVVKEHGASGDHEHFHIYVRSDVEERHDKVMQRWKRRLNPPADQHRFLWICKVTNRDTLIGQYLQSESGYEIGPTTFTEEDLTGLRSSYEVVEKAKHKQSSESKQIGLMTAADRIMSYAKLNGLGMSTKDDISHVIRQMYQEGFRMTSVLGRLNTIYKEIQMIRGYTVDLFLVD